MIAGSLSRRYARALLGIGTDQNNYEALGREVRALAEVFEVSDELGDVLTNPAFPRDDREKILDALFRRLGTSRIVKNFTMLLLDRERIRIIPDIARELDAMIDDKAGRVSATVVSATALSPMQLDKLKESLEKLSGKTVEMHKSEDPELLGGVVAKVGDVVYDGSLRTQLEQIREGFVR